MPAYRATARTAAGAVRAERARPGDGTRPAPGPSRDPGAVTVPVLLVGTVDSGTGQLATLGHCWATTVSAVFCWALLGKVIPPAGAGGSAAYAALSSVPAATRAGSSIGRVPPSRNRFSPSVEDRYSSHSRAAAGSGADLLIAWS